MRPNLGHRCWDWGQGGREQVWVWRWEKFKSIWKEDFTSEKTSFQRRLGTLVNVLMSMVQWCSIKNWMCKSVGQQLELYTKTFGISSPKSPIPKELPWSWVVHFVKKKKKDWSWRDNIIFSPPSHPSKYWLSPMLLDILDQKESTPGI